MDALVICDMLAICGECRLDNALVDFYCRRVQGALAFRNARYYTKSPELPQVCPYAACLAKKNKLKFDITRLFRKLGLPPAVVASGVDDNTALSMLLSLKNFYLVIPPQDLFLILVHVYLGVTAVCQLCYRILAKKTATESEYRLLKNRVSSLKQLLFNLRSLAQYVEKLPLPQLPTARGCIYG